MCYEIVKTPILMSKNTYINQADAGGCRNAPKKYYPFSFGGFLPAMLSI